MAYHMTDAEAWFEIECYLREGIFSSFEYGGLCAVLELMEYDDVISFAQRRRMAHQLRSMAESAPTLYLPYYWKPGDPVPRIAACRKLRREFQ